MPAEAIIDIRTDFLSSTPLLAIVDSSNVKIGWRSELRDFPCVIIYQVGGTSVGMLGYDYTNSGNRLESETINIDVFGVEDNGLYQVYQIADIITPRMLGLTYRKTNDLDDFNDETKLYRKSMSFKKTSCHVDNVS